MDEFFNDPSNEENEDFEENSDESSFVCNICWEKYEFEGIVKISCRHYCCNECLTSYIKTQIDSTGLMISITCGHQNCNVSFEDEDIITLLKDVDYIKKYQKKITTTFVSVKLF